MFAPFSFELLEPTQSTPFRKSTYNFSPADALSFFPDSFSFVPPPVTSKLFSTNSFFPCVRLGIYPTPEVASIFIFHQQSMVSLTM